MILAIWPSLMNPAVRLVMFGIVFTLAGLAVLATQWKNRQTWWQRSAAYRTSMAKIGSVAGSGSVLAVLFLVGGIVSIALGMAHIR